MLNVPFPEIAAVYSLARGFTLGNRSGDFITRRVGRLYPRGCGVALPKPAATAKDLYCDPQFTIHRVDTMEDRKFGNSAGKNLLRCGFSVNT